MQNLKWHHQGANAKKERLVKTSWRFIPQVFWPFVQIIRSLRTVMFFNLRTDQFEWLSNEEALVSLTCILIMMEQYWKWAVNEDILPNWMLIKVDGLSTRILTPIITALKTFSSNEMKVDGFEQNETVICFQVGNHWQK